MATIRVADISRWQGIIDWNTFKNHVQGVVIKASGADGGLYTDSLLARNRDEARRVGVPVWFYHYKGNYGTPASQAEYMVRAIGGLRPGEAIVLDDENEGRVNPTWCAQFADRIKQLTGLTIVVYSNQARFQGVNLAELSKRNIGAWIAKYGMNGGTLESAGSQPSIAGLPMIMWQYTSTARIPGVSANTVDMNVFYGDQSAFKRYGAPGSVPAPQTPAPAQAEQGTGYYTVVSGDTLSGIGSKVGVAWQTIAQTNGIVAPYTIYPGQKLRVFGGQTQAAAPAPVVTAGRTYTVVRNDTLSGIGAKTGVNWQTIAKLNSIGSPYTIYPGQVFTSLKMGQLTKLHRLMLAGMQMEVIFSNDYYPTMTVQKLCSLVQV